METNDAPPPTIAAEGRRGMEQLAHSCTIDESPASTSGVSVRQQKVTAIVQPMPRQRASEEIRPDSPMSEITEEELPHRLSYEEYQAFLYSERDRLIARRQELEDERETLRENHRREMESFQPAPFPLDPEYVTITVAEYNRLKKLQKKRSRFSHAQRKRYREKIKREVLREMAAEAEAKKRNKSAKWINTEQSKQTMWNSILSVVNIHSSSNQTVEKRENRIKIWNRVTRKYQ